MIPVHLQILTSNSDTHACIEEPVQSGMEFQNACMHFMNYSELTIVNKQEVKCGEKTRMVITATIEGTDKLVIGTYEV